MNPNMHPKIEEGMDRSRRASSRTLAGALGTALLGWSVVGCKPSPPTLTPKEVTVTQVSAAGLSVEVLVVAKNPNSVSLTAERVVAKITLDDSVDLGEVTVDAPVKLPANKKKQMLVPMTFKATRVFEIAALAARKEVIPYRVSGHATVGANDWTVDVPFSIDGSIPRVELLKMVSVGLPTLPVPGVAVPPL